MTSLVVDLKSIVERLFGAHVVPPDWEDTHSPENETKFLGHGVVGNPDNLAVKLTFDDEVVVVTKAAHSFTSQQMQIGSTTPQLIAGRNLRRRTVILKNSSAVNIAYSESNNMSITSAAYLKVDESVTLDTSAPVWCLAVSGSVNTLMVLQLLDAGTAE